MTKIEEPNDQCVDMSSPPLELTRLLELETKEAIDSFRWLATQLLQVATVLAVANLTAVGYAAANQQAGLLLLGAAITAILLLAYRSGMLGAVPLLCRLVALENTAESVLDRHLETGISLTLLNILGPEFLDEAVRINTISDRAQKQSAMRRLGRLMFTSLSTGKGTLILVLAILVQIIAIPVLLVVFGWELF